MPDDLPQLPETSRVADYEVRLRGHLGTQWSDWFAGLRVTLEDDGDTLLAGPLDQAALHGLLRRIRDLGMPLVSVARREPEPSTQRVSSSMESGR